MKEYDCPICKQNNRGGILLEKTIIGTESQKEFKKFECNYFKKLEEGFEKCGFEVWGTQFGYDLKEEELDQLINLGETVYIDKFLSQKTEENYTAKLILNKEEQTVILKFPDSDNQNFVEGASCPNCQSNIIDTKKGYMCEGYLEGDCGVFIPKTIANSELKFKDVELLLKGQMTNLIHDFTTLDGELFSAKLVLNDLTAKIEFSNEVCDCPEQDCPGTIISTKKTFRCTENKQDDPESCKYVFFKEISGATIDTKTFIELLTTKKTKKALSFISKKTNKPFLAHLILTSDGKLNFDFVNTKK